MFHNFQHPTNIWLCIFSVLWLLGGTYFAFHFIVAGKPVGAAIMGVYALAAVGLWFQSRAAAWILIAFACAGIIYSLTKIGHAPWYRVASPITWAVWALFLLWEFLSGGESQSDT
jgi:hypothetical protein